MENLGVLTSRHQTDSECKSRFVPWRYSTSQNHKNFKCGAETVLRVDFRMVSAVEQMWGELTQESKFCLEGSSIWYLEFHSIGRDRAEKIFEGKIFQLPPFCILSYFMFVLSEQTHNWYLANLSLFYLVCYNKHLATSKPKLKILG